MIKIAEEYDAIGNHSAEKNYYYEEAVRLAGEVQEPDNFHDEL